MWVFGQLFDKVEADIKPLAKKNAVVEEGANIEIAGTIYPGAEVHVGQSVLAVDKDIRRSRFFQEEGAVSHKSL